MAHQIYLTEGIILKKKDFSEADRLFWIYTEKFGMIMAAAKGARLQKSKLRYNLEIFSRGNFGLVPSKDFWKITDAQNICQPKNIFAAKIFSNIVTLMMRMIKGQEKNDFVWFELKKIHEKWFKSSLEKNKIKIMEIDFAVKFLHNLGYIDIFPKNKQEAVLVVNRAIKESML